MRIAICEDEIRERQELKMMIEASGREITLYSDAQSLLADWEKGVRFDFIFTDIVMENKFAGMDLCGRLSENGNDERVFLIIVTNYIEYAPEGYRNGVFRYLLKPLERNAVDQVFEDAEKELQKRGKVVVDAFDGERVIESRDILYVEVKGRYLDIYVQKKQEPGAVITMMQSMKTFASQLPKGEFSRVNRNQMVNLLRLTVVRQGHLILDNGMKLSVSRRQQRELQEALARCLA